MRYLYLLIAIAFISCGHKPIVKMADTILPEPTVLDNNHQSSAITDRYDSISTRIEYRHDTTNDCDSVMTTVVQIKKVASVNRYVDTIEVPVPTPFMVRDTIFQPTPIYYAGWKKWGWFLLGLLVGGVIVSAIVGFANKILRF